MRMWRGARFVALTLLVACGSTPGTTPSPARAKGEPCQADGDCASGLRCVGGEGRCSDEGFSCQGLPSCGPGLSCVTTSTPVQGCLHLPRRPGDSCDEQQLACGAGLDCFGLGERTCVRAADYQGKGCTAGWQCPPSLACRFGSDGGACAAPGDDLDVDCTETACAAPLLCNQGYEPPRCRPPGEMGEACFRGAELGLPGGDCAAGLVCNWALLDRAGAGRCAPPAAAGEPCRRDEECAAGLACHAPDAGVATCG